MKRPVLRCVASLVLFFFCFAINVELVEAAASVWLRVPGQQPGNAFINLNSPSLTAAELSRLPGLGRDVAARIIAERPAAGYATVQDLANVQGVGTVKIARLEGYFKAAGAVNPAQPVVKTASSGSTVQAPKASQTTVVKPAGLKGAGALNVYGKGQPINLNANISNAKMANVLANQLSLSDAQINTILGMRSQGGVQGYNALNEALAARGVAKITDGMGQLVAQPKPVASQALAKATPVVTPKTPASLHVHGDTVVLQAGGKTVNLNTARADVLYTQLREAGLNADWARQVCRGQNAAGGSFKSPQDVLARVKGFEQLAKVSESASSAPKAPVAKASETASNPAAAKAQEWNTVGQRIAKRTPTTVDGYQKSINQLDHVLGEIKQAKAEAAGKSVKQMDFSKDAEMTKLFEQRAKFQEGLSQAKVQAAKGQQIQAADAKITQLNKQVEALGQRVRSFQVNTRSGKVDGAIRDLQATQSELAKALQQKAQLEGRSLSEQALARHKGMQTTKTQLKALEQFKIDQEAARQAAAQQKAAAEQAAKQKLVAEQKAAAARKTAKLQNELQAKQQNLEAAKASETAKAPVSKVDQITQQRQAVIDKLRAESELYAKASDKAILNKAFKSNAQKGRLAEIRDLSKQLGEARQAAKPAAEQSTAKVQKSPEVKSLEAEIAKLRGQIKELDAAQTAKVKQVESQAPKAAESSKVSESTSPRLTGKAKASQTAKLAEGGEAPASSSGRQATSAKSSQLSRAQQARYTTLDKLMRSGKYKSIRDAMQTSEYQKASNDYQIQKARQSQAELMKKLTSDGKTGKQVYEASQNAKKGDLGKLNEVNGRIRDLRAQNAKLAKGTETTAPKASETAPKAAGKSVDMAAKLKEGMSLKGEAKGLDILGRSKTGTVDAAKYDMAGKAKQSMTLEGQGKTVDVLGRGKSSGTVDAAKWDIASRLKDAMKMKGEGTSGLDVLGRSKSTGTVDGAKFDMSGKLKSSMQGGGSTAKGLDGIDGAGFNWLKNRFGKGTNAQAPSAKNPAAETSSLSSKGPQLTGQAKASQTLQSFKPAETVEGLNTQINDIRYQTKIVRQRLLDSGQFSNGKSVYDLAQDPALRGKLSADVLKDLDTLKTLDTRVKDLRGIRKGLSETGKTVETAKATETTKAAESSKLAETKGTSTTKAKATNEAGLNGGKSSSQKALEGMQGKDTGAQAKSAKAPSTSESMASKLESSMKGSGSKATGPDLLAKAKSTTSGEGTNMSTKLEGSMKGNTTATAKAPSQVEALNGQIESLQTQRAAVFKKISDSGQFTSAKDVFKAASQPGAKGDLAEFARLNEQLGQVRAQKNGILNGEVKAATAKEGAVLKDATAEATSKAAEAEIYKAMDAKISSAQVKLQDAAAQMVAEGKYGSIQEAMTKDPVLKAESTKLAKASETLNSAKAKASQTEGIPGAPGGASDILSVKQAELAKVQAEQAALSQGGKGGLMSIFKKPLNMLKSRSLAKQEAQLTKEIQKLQNDPKYYEAEQQKLATKNPAQMKLINSIKTELQKPNLSDSYRAQLEKKLVQLENTPGPSFAKQSMQIIGLSIATNLVMNVGRQVMSGEGLDLKKAGEFLTDKKFWLGTAGVAVGSFVGGKLAQLPFIFLLTQRVAAFNPFLGLVAGMLPAFLGGAVGGQLLGGGMADADWTMLIAQTLGSTLGVALMMTMFPGLGMMGNLSGAMMGGMLAQKIVEMLRGPKAEGQDKEGVEGGDGQHDLPATDGGSRASFTEGDVASTFTQLNDAYTRYLQAEQAQDYENAALAYEEYASLKARLDEMRNASYTVNYAK